MPVAVSYSLVDEYEPTFSGLCRTDHPKHDKPREGRERVGVSGGKE